MSLWDFVSERPVESTIALGLVVTYGVFFARGAYNFYFGNSGRRDVEGANRFVIGRDGSYGVPISGEEVNRQVDEILRRK